jgi:hypothetical protein
MTTARLSTRHFRVPWSWKGRSITLGTTALLLVAMRSVQTLWGQLLIAATPMGTLAFGGRGYSMQDGQVLVHRFGWATRFDLDELQNVEMVPGVTLGSIRPFGNGGLFGLVGHFRNATLGSYRAYGTKAENAVVLHLERDRSS